MLAASVTNANASCRAWWRSLSASANADRPICATNSVSTDTLGLPCASPQATLRERRCMTTSTRMFTRNQWRKFIDNPVVEWGMFALGVVLLAISPLVGAIPGPGGIIVAGVGLALVLKTSMWAKRHYVKFKRWQPKAGRWTDWALQRRSAKRREEIRKAGDDEQAALSEPGGVS